MAESVNTQLADAILDAHLRALRVGASARADALRLLRLLEADLAAAIAVADPGAPALLRARQVLLRQLTGEEIHPLVQARYSQIAEATAETATQLALFEAQNTVALLQTVAELGITREVTQATLARQLNNTLLPSVATSQELSATASTWWLRQAAQLEQRVFDQLNIGIVQGEDIRQLVRRLRGTRARGFTDGVMEVSRRDATRLVRTQFNAVANTAQLAVYDAHPESIRAIRHTSTFDGRTSVLCVGRHGLQYTVPAHTPLGHTIPFLGGIPYHWH